MKTIDHFDFNGHKALVRVDFNVPLSRTLEITDDTRIKAAVPTIRKILKDGGSAILMSHLGRPKEGPEEKFSLKHIIPDLSAKLGVDVAFAHDCVGTEAEEKASGLRSGEVLLLENVRFHKGETKGDEDFAKSLSKLGTLYVNDAFGTAHRAHASTTGVAKFFERKCCGYVMSRELENARRVLENPQKPFIAIMGGAKISDKILIIERLLEKVDHFVIGGAMCYTFFKTLGGKVGDSLVEDDKLDFAKSLIEKARERKVGIYLPTDSVVANGFDNDALRKISSNYSIDPGWMGLDLGPEAQELFSDVIAKSKTILWNGPMGAFEMPNFAKGTDRVARAVVTATENGAFSLIGGGDSAAAVNGLGYGDKVSYVSTGGGALLEYMEGKVLPGVAALEE